MHSFIYNTDTAKVNTTKGPIRGYEYDGLSIFKGIPYAKARRFHDPEPMSPWDEELNCTNYGYVCPLLENEKPAAELCVPHRYWIMDEDCQNLNIWTPGLDHKKRPVMVWLHGGGYWAGSAIEQKAYDGKNMAQYGDCVVVSINHRLNLLGYLDLSDFGEEYENSGNAGTSDIILALQWIKENIEQFGGNPENVCLFGQSGGGGKITTLLQSPAADGLFHKGINMSGVLTDLMTDATGSAKPFVMALLEDLNLDSVKDLEEIPYDILARSYLKLKPKFEQEGINTGGKPFVNKYYHGDPLVYGFRQESSHIPLLVSSVFGEFPCFAPAPVDKNKVTRQEAERFARNTLDGCASEEEIEKLITSFRVSYPHRNILDLLQIDYLFRRPIIEYVKLRSSLNHSTYTYLFDQDTALEDGRAPWHCSDIPYVFHNTEYAPYTQVDGVDELETTIFETIMTFARTGNPNNPRIPHINACTPEKEEVLFFSNDLRVSVNPDHELIPLAPKILKPALDKLKLDTKIQH